MDLDQVERAAPETASTPVDISLAGPRRGLRPLLDCAGDANEGGVGPDAFFTVSYVRELYDLRAVETPWQRRYVTHFATS